MALEAAILALKELLTIIRLEIEATPLEIRQEIAKQRYEDFKKFRKFLGFRDE